MARKYRGTYEWTQLPVVSIGCGAIVAALTYWNEHNAVGSAIAGAVTMVLVAALWAFRVVRQRDVTESERRE